MEPTMTVRIVKRNHVWTIVHSRPAAKNAMDPEHAKCLYEAFLEFDQDDTARVAVLWGDGGAFCAGYDLKLAAAIDQDDPQEYSPPSLSEPKLEEPTMAPMGPSRLELSKPVIAAIAGPAVAGGMELALWADLRVMEESAFMGVYCRRWGVPLIDGGTVRLPRMIGQGRALDLILTGRRVDAIEAKAIGLCDYLVADGQSRVKAEALAADIARFPQQCMLADRHSAIQNASMEYAQAMQNEWRAGMTVVNEGLDGAARFAKGKGRGGDFADI
jgi:enoyl-CoA hydratase